ncbi:serine/threonine-protein kinase [Nocardiopsis sp. ATB16-24]|uniref:serine/threonine-protein kinase n=1 Tax=Nocardiopsis sp. ATB16-24 TaxID=3019555 RepID=UPI0025562324|nr:serine/threonine-protein kinase [Nocardiopsis sp. ATB16-24]
MRHEMTEIGGYRLVRELGQGGFGVVYLGENVNGEQAAIKLLRVGPDAGPRFFEDFAKEVEAAKRVESFCTARVLDADPHAEQPWIATEYIDGPTLAQDVRNRGPRTGADLHWLAVQTATALRAIHAVGMVHRDLKPSNILLGADGPRVIDFGIARAFEATSFTVSAMLGTPQYMAPEQLEDGRLTPAVDIHAWGAVMVYAATGRHAFTAQSQSGLLRKILLEDPDHSGVPEPLGAVVRRCMAKDPARRPSARELLDLLITGHTSPQAAPPPSLSRPPSPPPPGNPFPTSPPGSATPLPLSLLESRRGELAVWVEELRKERAVQRRMSVIRFLAVLPPVFFVLAPVALIIASLIFLD